MEKFNFNVSDNFIRSLRNGEVPERDIFSRIHDETGEYLAFFLSHEDECEVELHGETTKANLTVKEMGQEPYFCDCCSSGSNPQILSKAFFPA